MKFEAFTTAPKIFTDKESTVEIPCSADDKMETLTCTPTKDHMESGKNTKLPIKKCVKEKKLKLKLKLNSMVQIVSNSHSSFLLYSLSRYYYHQKIKNLY